MAPPKLVQAVLCKIIGFNLTHLEYKNGELKKVIRMRSDPGTALFHQSMIIEKIHIEILYFNESYYILYRS